MRASSDSAVTTMVLVTRPESSALAEAARTSTELRALSVRNPASHRERCLPGSERCPVAKALERRGQAALAALPEVLRSLPRTTLTLRPVVVMGVQELRHLDSPVVSATAVGASSANVPGIAPLIETLAANPRGVVLTMGKGGVGKTTVAAAIAVTTLRPHASVGEGLRSIQYCSSTYGGSTDFVHVRERRCRARLAIAHYRHHRAVPAKQHGLTVSRPLRLPGPRALVRL